MVGWSTKRTRGTGLPDQAGSPPVGDASSPRGGAFPQNPRYGLGENLSTCVFRLTAGQEQGPRLLQSSERPWGPQLGSRGKPKVVRLLVSQLHRVTHSTRQPVENGKPSGRSGAGRSATQDMLGQLSGNTYTY